MFPRRSLLTAIPILSVFRFSLCERKTKNKKKIKYRSAEG